MFIGYTFQFWLNTFRFQSSWNIIFCSEILNSPDKKIKYLGISDFRGFGTYEGVSLHIWYFRLIGLDLLRTVNLLDFAIFMPCKIHFTSYKQCSCFYKLIFPYVVLSETMPLTTKFILVLYQKFFSDIQYYVPVIF